MKSLVTLFVPCFVDQLRPRAGIAAVEILEGLGYEVRVRPDILCCGQPFTNSGAAGQGAALARRWYEGMQAEHTVVVLSSSCTVQLRHAARDGVVAGRSGPGGRERLEVLEFCEFLDTRHPDESFGRLHRSVCLHSACHGLRDSDADRHARAVLGRVEGLRILQGSRADECCGFGGTFSTSFPAVSVRMGQDRLADILTTGARDIVATDLSCLLHLEGIAGARGEKLTFRHISEILHESLGGKEQSQKV